MRQALKSRVRPLLVIACLATSPATGAPPLVQVPGNACVSENGTGGACVDGRSLTSPGSVVVSGDGRNVYVTSLTGGAGSVATFDRNPLTGALTQKAGLIGCMSETGSSNTCTNGVSFGEVVDVALSPDGRSVYLAAQGSDAVAVLDRDANGTLTQKGGAAGCINELGADGCADGLALDGANAVTVSPDGRNVYATSTGSDSIVIFDRDLATGALTQKAGVAGCISETGTGASCTDGASLFQPRRPVVSQDGKNVYVPAFDSDAVAVFTRNLSNGSLTQQASATVANVTSVAIGPDGRTVYVTSSNGIVMTFDRDQSTGALTPKAGVAGCVSETGNGVSCADGKALAQAQEAAVSPDGRSVYVASAGTTDALAIFDRDPVTGQLTQQGGVTGCISETGTAGACMDGVALDTVTAVTVSPDGATVYALATTTGAVVILDREVPVYDLDGDGTVDPLTDALLLLRHTFGFVDAALIDDAVDAVNCTRCTAPLIDAYVDALRNQ